MLPPAPSTERQGERRTVVFNLEAAEPLQVVAARRLRTFIPSSATETERPLDRNKELQKHSHLLSLFSSLCPRVLSQGQRAKARTFRGCGKEGVGGGELVVCLFTQCHGRFGSSGGHVLSSGPTELNSLAPV